MLWGNRTQEKWLWVIRNWFRRKERNIKREEVGSGKKSRLHSCSRESTLSLGVERKSDQSCTGCSAFLHFRHFPWLPLMAGHMTGTSVFFIPKYNLTEESRVSLFLASVQFSWVAQSCLTLWDPMNRSTLGLPVHHQLPEFTQTHVQWVGDGIQPSHPLSSPSSLHQKNLILVVGLQSHLRNES